MKEDVDCVIIFTKMSAFLNKLEQIPFLFLGNRFSGNRIMDNHRCQFKSKRIFTNQVQSGHRLQPSEWLA